MSTFNEALLYNQAEQFGAPRFSSMANIEAGAQNGIGPRIPRLDAATPLIFNNSIIVMLSAPSMWDNYPELQRQLKALYELHARSVSNIDFGYTLDFHEQAMSHDGQQLPMPTTSKRTAVGPTFTWGEQHGNIVWNIHAKWISDVQNPDTQVSQLSSQMADDEIPPWLLSTISASFIAVLPDPTGIPDRIIDAAVYTAVMPTETGMIGFKREIGGAGESPERSVTYKGIVQHNDNTRELGRLVMAARNLHKVDYRTATTYAGVDDTLSGMGLSKEVEDAMRDFKLMV